MSEILVHEVGEHSYSADCLLMTAISNDDGVFCYFVDEEKAYAFETFLTKTKRRLELLLEHIELSENDQTSYNELEFIVNEIKQLDFHTKPDKEIDENGAYSNEQK